jgi:hypothetical protein
MGCEGGGFSTFIAALLQSAPKFQLEIAYSKLNKKITSPQ